MEKNRYLYIRLFPEASRTSKEQPPIARFVLRVSNAGANRRPYTSPGVISSSLTCNFGVCCASLFLIFKVRKIFFLAPSSDGVCGLS